MIVTNIPNLSTKVQRYTAFTLAEVLITLGIIGVVAAMTIPILMANYQEKQYLTQFKETYSMLSQAYTMSSQDNGTAQLWTSSQDAYDNMKPYLKVSKDCGYATSCGAPNVLTLNGAATHGGIRYHLVLVNGATVGFGGMSTNDWGATPILSDNNVNNVSISVDLNGIKPPNQFGYDFFLLALSTKNQSPVITGPPMWWANENVCKKSDAGSGGWYRGGSCSTWVIKHGNMDYMHRDLNATEWAN